jgi:hypothetical protein
MPDPVLPNTSASRFPRYAALVVGSWCAIAALLVGWRTLGKAEAKEATPRVMSGVAQLKYAPSGKELRWTQKEIVVAIDESVDALGPGAREAVQAAFVAWLDAGGKLPKLRFDTARGTRLSERPDGKNTVTVAPIDISGHKNDLAIAITFSDMSSGVISEADLVINARHDFGVLDEERDDNAKDDDRDEDDRDDDEDRDTDGDRDRRDTRSGSCQNRYDLQNVTTHEVGHFFGLGEDPTDEPATMFQSIARCETQKRTLEPMDRGAVAGLYVLPLGDGEETTASTAGGCATSPPAPSQPLGAALGIGLALAARTFRKRRR